MSFLHSAAFHKNGYCDAQLHTSRWLRVFSTEFNSVQQCSTTFESLFSFTNEIVRSRLRLHRPNAADNPTAWAQNPSAKSIYSSSFAWASHLITSPALPSEYPLLLVGERAKDQVRIA